MYHLASFVTSFQWDETARGFLHRGKEVPQVNDNVWNTKYTNKVTTNITRICKSDCSSILWAGMLVQIRKIVTASWFNRLLTTSRRNTGICTIVMLYVTWINIFIIDYMKFLCSTCSFVVCTRHLVSLSTCYIYRLLFFTSSYCTAVITSMEEHLSKLI